MIVIPETLRRRRIPEGPAAQLPYAVEVEGSANSTNLRPGERRSGHSERRLLDHRLVDEIVLLTYPVVVGQGTRLFPATGSGIGLELVDLRSTPKGLTIQTYRTTGRPAYETATA